MRGSFTNNLTAYQFIYAMRRTTCRQQITLVQTGNCLPDEIPLLTVTSNPRDNKNEESELDNHESVFGEQELFDFELEIPSNFV